MKKRSLMLMALIAVAFLVFSAADSIAAKGKVAITLDEAVTIATDHSPGEVIKVEYERGRYEVKIRRDEGGRVEVYVDAKSGEIVKVKDESRKYRDSDDRDEYRERRDDDGRYEYRRDRDDD